MVIIINRKERAVIQNHSFLVMCMLKSFMMLLWSFVFYDGIALYFFAHYEQDGEEENCSYNGGGMTKSGYIR